MLISPFHPLSLSVSRAIASKLALERAREKNEVRVKNIAALAPVNGHTGCPACRDTHSKNQTKAKRRNEGKHVDRLAQQQRPRGRLERYRKVGSRSLDDFYKILVGDGVLPVVEVDQIHVQLEANVAPSG